MSNECGILDACLSDQEEKKLTLMLLPLKSWRQAQNIIKNQQAERILQPWPLDVWAGKKADLQGLKSFQPKSAGKSLVRLLNHDGRRNRITVTVCVAAICNGTTIFGASDRMLTAGDIEFEPNQTKIISLTTSIVIMIAGDSALQIEIALKLSDEASRRIKADPTQWLNIRDIADLYAAYYNQARLKRAENTILAPLGLTNETFINRQQQMNSKLVNQIATELLNFSCPDVQAIIAGVDSTGTHIYVVNNSDVRCHNAIGFASIGVGAWHANSQFMFAGHTRSRPLPETLWLTYSAKRRAEVAPGVGEGTDMFMVGPNLGSYAPLRVEVLQALEEIYRDTRINERELARQADEKVKHYVEEITAAATPPATPEAQSTVPEATVSGSPPTNQETSVPGTTKDPSTT